MKFSQSCLVLYINIDGFLNKKDELMLKIYLLKTHVSFSLQRLNFLFDHCTYAHG